MTSTGLGQRGQAAASVTARRRVVARALVKQSFVLAIVPALPAAAAAAEGEIVLSVALAAPAALLAALGLIARRIEIDADLRRIEAVVTLSLVFLCSAVAILPGFIVLGMPPLDGFFEGVSGITTTGLSVARGTEDWPWSGHFLRAWTQWCGGVVVAVAGVALLMGAGRAARVMGQQSVGDLGYVASTRVQARVILIGYSALTAIGIAGCLILLPGFEGPLVALAAVSTGGFTPRPTSLAEYALAGQVFTMALCVAGAVSLLFYAQALRRGPRVALREGTVPVTLALIFGGAAIFAAADIVLLGWDPARLVPGVLNFVSAQTTAGFSAAPVLSAGAPVILLILAMVLGGDVGSTTGGIKAARTITLAKMIALVFLRLRLPDRAVTHVRIGGKRAEVDQLILATALLGIYLISALVFWLALMAGGYEPLVALFDAVSALSGVGLSTGVIGPDLPAALKALTIGAMMLGRLEFFAFIVLFLPSTWISRR